jgi:hypothetical protein
LSIELDISLDDLNRDFVCSIQESDVKENDDVKQGNGLKIHLPLPKWEKTSFSLELFGQCIFGR